MGKQLDHGTALLWYWEQATAVVVISWGFHTEALE